MSLADTNLLFPFRPGLVMDPRLTLNSSSYICPLNAGMQAYRIYTKH